jgi:hypothetical protein
MKKTLIKLAIIGATSLLFTGCFSSSNSNVDTPNGTPEGLIKVPAGYKASTYSIKKEDSIYESERKQLLAETIRKPVMPVKTQDKILRVLIMPYVNENNVLQTENYQFTKVDEGRWIVGEYLAKDKGRAEKLLTPLVKEEK